MARALRVRIIEINHDIEAATHSLELEQKTINAQRAKLEAKQSELEQQFIALKLQIKRAHQYSVSHAIEELLTCVPCFVFHGVLQNLMPTESTISGVNLYKCQRCGEEIERDGVP